MKKDLHLSCAELGNGNGCTFVAHGKTESEVINNMFSHARKKHAKVIANMSSADEKNMKQKMHDMLMKQN